MEPSMQGIEELERLLEQWNRYYREKFGWADANTLEMRSSELLTSPHIDLRLEHLRRMGHALPFACDNCQVLISGLPRRFYTDLYGWTYIDMCSFFYGQVLPYAVKAMEEAGFSGLCFIDPMGRERNLNFILTPRRSGADARALSEKLTAFLQERYRAELFGGEEKVSCFSVLSRPVKDRHALMAAYQEAEELKELAFFRMEPVVFTPQDYEMRREEVDALTLNEYRTGYASAVNRGDAGAAAALLEELLLGRIKPSFDQRALDGALHFVDESLFAACVTYQLTPGEKHSRGEFYSIEHCCAVLKEETARVAGAIGRAGTSLSYVSREALYYIHTHYASDVSLDALAAYVNVVPGYICRVFRQEVGQSVVKYVNALRIQKARELLETTDKRLRDIGALVGIPNTKYLSRLFHAQVGISPQEYRSKFGRKWN